MQNFIIQIKHLAILLNLYMQWIHIINDSWLNVTRTGQDKASFEYIIVSTFMDALHEDTRALFKELGKHMRIMICF